MTSFHSLYSVFTKLTKSVCLKCPSLATCITNIRELVDSLFRAGADMPLATTNLTAQTLMQAILNMPYKCFYTQ